MIRAPNGKPGLVLGARGTTATWINWNNLGSGCRDAVGLRQERPARSSRQPLGPGSHRIEWAYREGGARLYDTIVLREDDPNLFPDQCSD